MQKGEGRKDCEALLKTEDQDRLDEIILNTKTVYYMLLALPSGLFETDQFDELIEVIKKFLRYTNMPNQKLRPQVSLSLLASFEEHSLGIEQIETIFELTDSSQCDDLDIKFVLDMVSLSFEAAVSVTSELFDLAIISIDWENIDLYANDNYNMQKLCSIIICLIQNLGKYDEDDPKDALDYVFVDPDALCRKFVDECLAKIPGYHYVLKNLKYIKSLGGDTEKLADMFEQANYALPCNYQCDYIDKIAIYGKERADNYEIQQNEIITINKQ